MAAAQPDIRRATDADIPRLVEIRAAVRENQLSDPTRVTVADYAWFIAHSDIWVRTDHGAIQGFAAGDPRDGSIWALFVDPPYEHRGLGRSLLARACHTAQSAGFSAATLSTAPGTRAERFYRAVDGSKPGAAPGARSSLSGSSETSDDYAVHPAPPSRSGHLASFDQLAPIPPEDVWLASPDKRARALAAQRRLVRLVETSALRGIPS